ncbi:MAG: LptA/OstA family protein [Phenylobacterium sp.]
MKSLIGLMALAAGAAALAAPAAAQIATHSKAPVDIVADEASTNNSGCEATWSGNAEALQDNARLRADVIKIFNKPSAAKPAKSGTTGSGCGELDRLEAHGNVYIVKPDQRVRGDHAVYEAGSTTVTVTGDVVAIQGQNVLRGDKMVFNTDTGQGQVVGKAKGRGAKDRPRGVFYPQQSSDKPSSSNSDKPK